MDDPTENALSSRTTPNVSGGAGSALDMSNERDRGLVRQATKRWPKRWRGLTDSIKDEFVSGLVEAGRVCRSQLTDPEKSLDAAKALGSIVKTAAVMEGQQQADEHLEEKNARLDGGLATEAVKLYASSAPTEAV